MGKFAVRAALSARRDEVREAVIRRITRPLARILALAKLLPENKRTPDDIPALVAALRKYLVGTRPAKRQNARPGNRKRIVHLIGSLQPGGAERQLCNFLVGARRRGHDVELLLIYDTADQHNHFRQMLESEGIPIRVVGGRLYPWLRIPSRAREVIRAIPREFFVPSMDILGELLADPPDVFHAWLDHPNIWGGIPAVIAEIPLIVLSTRNVNPTHFPYLASPYLHPLYQTLAASSAVQFINNSHAGARDYAEWLCLPIERFNVVLNGVQFDSIRRPDSVEIDTFRHSQGIPGSAKVVAGVFRLSEEKQPLLFLEVARRLVAANPDVYVVVAGIGPMEGHLVEFVRANHLERRVFLLGRRRDVPTILSASRLAMLASRQEGTPNVLLEAQSLGCPVVSTRAGGAADAVVDGRTGLLVDVGDVEGLAAAAQRLLDDEGLWHRMTQAGPQFVRDHFGMERMVDETLAIYKRFGEENDREI